MQTQYMDGVKLEKWRKTFEDQVTALRPGFDALFLPKKFEDAIRLQLDELSQNFYLELDPDLPADMHDRLEKLLADTKPEDSV